MSRNKYKEENRRLREELKRERERRLALVKNWHKVHLLLEQVTNKIGNSHAHHVQDLLFQEE